MISGTDPLDPATNLDSFVTKSIDINRTQAQNPDRLSRSVDSYVDDEASRFLVGSDPIINVSCDSSTNNSRKIAGGSSSGIQAVGQQRLLEQWLAGKV